MEERQKTNLSTPYALLATAIFGLVSILLAGYHEMWRDELHIWVLCSASDNLTDFFSNRVTEGAPLVWHLIVFSLTRITDHVQVLTYVNILFSSLSVFLLLRYAPLLWWQKLLLILGYYLLFEFNMMARSYALGVFLLFLTITLHDQGRRGLMLLCFWLLVNTNMMMTIIGFSLLTYFHFWREYGGRYRFVMFLAVMVALSDVAWQTFIDYQYADTLPLMTDQRGAMWLLHKAALLQKGLIPIADVSQTHLWNTSWIEATNVLWAGLLLGSVISLALVLYIFDYFWRDKYLVFAFFVGVVAMYVLFAFFWGGSQRHWGHFFILLLACQWLFLLRYPQVKRINIVLVISVVAQLVGAGIMLFQDVKRPFSHAEKVAEYIKRELPTDAIITGYPDYTIEPLTLYLPQREVYNLQTQKPLAFVNWNRPHVLTVDEMVQRLEQLRQQGKPVVLVLSKEAEMTPQMITGQWPEKTTASSVTFEKAVEKYENYEVVLLKPY